MAEAKKGLKGWTKRISKRKGKERKGKHEK
jgi:hypothetical protein